MPSAIWGLCVRLCRVFSGAASNTTTSFRRARGVIKAAAHFDSDRGYKFSTYAVPVILGEMRRLFREGGTVKVSRGLKELSMKAVRLSEQIETETGKAPSVSVLAEKLGVPEEKCAEALNAAAQPSPSPATTKTMKRTFPSTHRKKKSPITSPCSKY